MSVFRPNARKGGKVVPQSAFDLSGPQFCIFPEVRAILAETCDFEGEKTWLETRTNDIGLPPLESNAKAVVS